MTIALGLDRTDGTFLVDLGMPPDREQGKATILLSPGGGRVTVPYRTVMVDGRPVVSLYPDTTGWKAIARSNAMAIQGVRYDPIALDTGPMAPVVERSEACLDAALRALGIEPAPMVDHAPISPAETLFADSDYPANAAARREEGVVGVIATVAPDGRTHDCRVVQSSGSSALDLTSCARIVGRLRFRPASAPVRYSYQRIRWMLPTD